MGQGSPESSPLWVCDGWLCAGVWMDREVLLPRKDCGAAPGMPVGKEK